MLYVGSPSPSFQINYVLPILLRLLLLLLLTTFTSAIAIIFFNIFMVSYSVCVSVVKITSIYRGQLPSSPVDSVFTSSVLHKMRGISLVSVVTSWVSALSAVRSCHQLPLHHSRCFVYWRVRRSVVLPCAHCINPLCCSDSMSIKGTFCHYAKDSNKEYAHCTDKIPKKRCPGNDNIGALPYLYAIFRLSV